MRTIAIVAVAPQESASSNQQFSTTDIVLALSLIPMIVALYYIWSNLLGGRK